MHINKKSILKEMIIENSQSTNNHNSSSHISQMNSNSLFNSARISHNPNLNNNNNTLSINSKTIDNNNSNYFKKTSLPLSKGKVTNITSQLKNSVSGNINMDFMSKKTITKTSSNLTEQHVNLGKKISVGMDNSSSFIKKFPNQKISKGDFNTIEAVSSTTNLNGSNTPVKDSLFNYQIKSKVNKQINTITTNNNTNNNSHRGNVNINLINTITSNFSKIKKPIPQTTTNSGYVKSPVFDSVDINKGVINQQTPTSTSKQNFFNNMLITGKNGKNIQLSSKTRTININYSKDQNKFTSIKDITHTSNSQPGSIGKDSTGIKYIKTSLSKASSNLNNIYMKNSNSLSPSSSINNQTKSSLLEEKDDKKKKNSIFKLNIEKTLVNSNSQIVNQIIIGSDEGMKTRTSELNNKFGIESKMKETEVNNVDFSKEDMLKKVVLLIKEIEERVNDMREVDRDNINNQVSGIVKEWNSTYNTSIIFGKGGFQGNTKGNLVMIGDEMMKLKSIYEKYSKLSSNTSNSRLIDIDYIDEVLSRTILNLDYLKNNSLLSEKIFSIIKLIRESNLTPSKSTSSNQKYEEVTNKLNKLIKTNSLSSDSSFPSSFVSYLIKVFTNQNSQVEALFCIQLGKINSVEEVNEENVSELIDNIIILFEDAGSEINKFNIYLTYHNKDEYFSSQMIYSKEEIIKQKDFIDSLINLYNLIVDMLLLLKDYFTNRHIIESLSSQFSKSSSNQILTNTVSFNSLLKVDDKSASILSLLYNFYFKLPSLLISGQSSINLNGFNEIYSFLNTSTKDLKGLLNIKNDYNKRIKEKYPKLFFLNNKVLLFFLKWNFDLIKKLKPSNSKQNQANSSPLLSKNDISKINYFYFTLNNVYITFTSKNNITYISGIHTSKSKFINFQNKLDLSKLLSSATDLLSVFNKIDQELKYSLKCEIVNSLNNFPKNNFFDWVFMSSLQVSICNINLIFSNEISQILLNSSNNEEDESSDESDKNNESALNRAEKLKSGIKKPKKFEEGTIIKNDLEALLFKYQAWIDLVFKRLSGLSKEKESALTMFIVKSISAINSSSGLYNDFSSITSGKEGTSSQSGQVSGSIGYVEFIKQNIINILISLNNHRNILQQLISSNIIEVDSYDWLKFIRHLWDDEKKDVIVECGGWSIYQQYNFISNQKIILTPQTEKVFLFAASCFREKSAAIIKTTFNSYSYYHIFEEFAGNFWISLDKLNINESKDYINQIKVIFDCNSINKNWIFLENIDFLSTETVKSLSKLMQIIQQEIILNEIKQTSVTSNSIQKMFCLFGCLKVEENYKVKEAFLKSSCRIMNLTKPDIQFFIKNIIEINGFVSLDVSSSLFKQGEILKSSFSVILNTIEKLISSQDNNFYFDFYTLFSIQNFFIYKMLINLSTNLFTHQTSSSSSPSSYIKSNLIRNLVEFLVDYIRNLNYFSDEEILNSLTLSLKQNLNSMTFGGISNNDISQLKDEISSVFNNYIKKNFSSLSFENSNSNSNVANNKKSIQSSSNIDLLVNTFIQTYETQGLIVNDSLLSNFYSFWMNTISSNYGKVPIIYGSRYSGRSTFISNSLNIISSSISSLSQCRIITCYENFNFEVTIKTSTSENINFYVLERVTSLDSHIYLTVTKPLIFKYGINTSNSFLLSHLSQNNVSSNKSHRFILELDSLKSLSHSDISFYQMINISYSSSNIKKYLLSFFNKYLRTASGLGIPSSDEIAHILYNYLFKLIFAIEDEKNFDKMLKMIIDFFSIADLIMGNIQKEAKDGKALQAKHVHFNILTQSFLLVNKGRQHLLSLILENSKTLLKQELYYNLQSIIQSQPSLTEYDIYLDLKSITFSLFNNHNQEVFPNINLFSYFMKMNFNKKNSNEMKVIIYGRRSTYKTMFIKNFLTEQSIQHVKYSETTYINHLNNINPNEVLGKVVYIEDLNVNFSKEYFNQSKGRVIVETLSVKDLNNTVSYEINYSNDEYLSIFNKIVNSNGGDDMRKRILSSYVKRISSIESLFDMKLIENVSKFKVESSVLFGLLFGSVFGNVKNRNKKEYMSIYNDIIRLYERDNNFSSLDTIQNLLYRIFITDCSTDNIVFIKVNPFLIRMFIQDYLLSSSFITEEKVNSTSTFKFEIIEISHKSDIHDYISRHLLAKEKESLASKSKPKPRLGNDCLIFILLGNQIDFLFDELDLVGLKGLSFKRIYFLYEFEDFLSDKVYNWTLLDISSTNYIVNYSEMIEKYVRKIFNQRINSVRDIYSRVYNSISLQESDVLLDCIVNSILESKEDYLNKYDFSKSCLISHLMLKKQIPNRGFSDILLQLSFFFSQTTSHFYRILKEFSCFYKEYIGNPGCRLSLIETYPSLISQIFSLSILLSDESLILSLFYEDNKEVLSLFSKINKTINKLSFINSPLDLSHLVIDHFLYTSRIVYNIYQLSNYTLTHKINLVSNFLSSSSSKIDYFYSSLKEQLPQRNISAYSLILPILICKINSGNEYKSYIDFISSSSKAKDTQDINDILTRQINILSIQSIQTSRLYIEMNQIVSTSLKQYSHLTDYNEFLNSELFLFEDLRLATEDKTLNLKPDFFINLLLEKLFLGINNKFLLAILITLQIMKEKMEITEEEINFILFLLKNNFKIKQDSSIKLRSKETNIPTQNELHTYNSMKTIYANISVNNSSARNHSNNAYHQTSNNQNKLSTTNINNSSNKSIYHSNLSANSIEDISFIERQKIQAKLLIKMYSSDQLCLDDELSISQNFVEIVESILNSSQQGNQANSSLQKKSSQVPSILINYQSSGHYINIFRKNLTKDSHKIIFSLIFCEEESLSYFKYLINKYLKPIHAIDQYKINSLLKRKVSFPIGIKSDNAINVTNFLCSLAAYYEIDFFIIRNTNFNSSCNISKLSYDYNYILDSDIWNFINQAITNGHWILITSDLTFSHFSKILSLVKSKEKVTHNNFKLFIDINAISQLKLEYRQESFTSYQEYKLLVENFCLMLQVDSGSVDDLEAAHDIWVNVLEENILNKTLMDETQKEYLNLNNNFKHNEISAVSREMKKKVLSNQSQSNFSKSEINELGKIHRHLNNIKFN